MDASSPFLLPLLGAVPLFHVLTVLLLPDYSWNVRVWQAFGCFVLNLFLIAFVSPLALLAVVFAIGNVWRAWGRRRRLAVWLSGCMAAGVLVLGAASFLFSSKRSPEELVLKWQGTGYARNQVGEFAQAKNLDALRYILTHGTANHEFEMGRVAIELSKLSKSAEDVELILSALERSESDSYARTNFSQALATQTGITPGDDWKGADWRTALTAP
jgi:hypothetical protein